MAEPYRAGARTLATEGLERDVAALAAMHAHRAQALPHIRARAENWRAGLSTITGVLGTAAVIDGIGNLSDLDGPLVVLLSILMALGGLLLALGIYNALTAAHGDEQLGVAVDEFLRSDRVAGAAAQWDAMIAAAVQQTQAALRIAIQSTIFGTLLLGTALVLTWVVPKSSTSDTSRLCLQVDNQVVQLEGSLLAVRAGTATIVECPE